MSYLNTNAKSPGYVLKHLFAISQRKYLVHFYFTYDHFPTPGIQIAQDIEYLGYWTLILRVAVSCYTSKKREERNISKFRPGSVTLMTLKAGVRPTFTPPTVSWRPRMEEKKGSVNNYNVMTHGVAQKTEKGIFLIVSTGKNLTSLSCIIDCEISIVTAKVTMETHGRPCQIWITNFSYEIPREGSCRII
ncbi:unnamed protein product [Nesidiocoris tenuis]|uniref:Uncharacterized protein n=1 Tax=Nesidiocoris tenuis TaxID=355587 RepID=A0A6H5HPX0_9HEMI|nr:unnamed protein product [Nesidiocoris tenuis]